MYFTPLSSVSIISFEHIIASWDVLKVEIWTLVCVLRYSSSWKHVWAKLWKNTVMPWSHDFVFSKHALKLSCSMRFICLKRIRASAFFCNKMSICTWIEIRKIEKSLTFTVCQLLISQVHCNGLKLWILNGEICVANSDCLIISSHITNLNKIN